MKMKGFFVVGVLTLVPALTYADTRSNPNVLRSLAMRCEAYAVDGSHGYEAAKFTLKSQRLPEPFEPVKFPPVRISKSFWGVPSFGEQRVPRPGSKAPSREWVPTVWVGMEILDGHGKSVGTMATETTHFRRGQVLSTIFSLEAAQKNSSPGGDFDLAHLVCEIVDFR